MYCSRRLYKGNSYEFCLPLADTGVTEVYFYTDGEFKVGKEPVICGDTMCFTLAAEDIEAMKDGVLRYTDNGDLDTNTQYVVVTPEGYEAKTLDEIVEEAYQSGFTDGYASGITECHPDYSKMPITFECVDTSGGTAYIVCPPTLYHQLNDGPIVPSEWEIDLEDNLIYVPSVWPMEDGDTMRFWASSATTQSDLFNYSNSWWAHESNTGKYKIYGNIMSLQYEQDEYQDATELKYAFYASGGAIFKGSSVITDASDLVLPATTLISEAYHDMFYGCTNLTSAPELPATTLANWCYVNMFSGCTSLATAPALPATTLETNCYMGMFRNCTSLTQASELPATTLAQGCYHGMFIGCTSLTTAPELPVTALTSSCYHTMFMGCTSLTTAPELPATRLAMQCYRGMFSGCTSLETAPELPATTLASTCYGYMFKDCTSLNHIKCLATNPGKYTTSWLSGVSLTGTFETPSTATWTTGESGIPSGWTRVDVN